MEEGSSAWSLRRMRVYDQCPTQYKYHYYDSHLAYKDDCSLFHKKLYDRRHEKGLDDLYRDSLYSTLPILFSEGHRSKKVNEEFESKLYRALQSYPELDREALADDFFIKFGKCISAIMNLQEFSWLSPQPHNLYFNEFITFEADDATIDLFLPLAWRSEGKINVLHISSKQCDQKQVDLAAYYFFKVYNNDLENFAFWNLSGTHDKWNISRKTAAYESLLNLRELIMKTTSLLNNWQNDFPFSENMALCQACKYFSLCEKFENQGFK